MPERDRHRCQSDHVLSAPSRRSRCGEDTGQRACVSRQIVGVGLDSSESRPSAGQIQHVFAPRPRRGFLSHRACRRGRAARAMSGKRSMCSASGGSITATASLEDQTLVSRLARERMALTVCPLSNLRLRVIDDLIHHPLRRMMDKGLVVTVNSDDPAYFGGYVNENYRAVSDALALSARRNRRDRSQRHRSFADDAAAKRPRSPKSTAYSPTPVKPAVLRDCRATQARVRARSEAGPQALPRSLPAPCL